MLKRVSLFYVLTLAAVNLAAQAPANVNAPKLPFQPQKAPYNRHIISTPEVSVPDAINVVAAPVGVTSRANVTETINELYWDAQSYGCIQQRIYGDDEGNPVAAWIYSIDAAGGYPERGTGWDKRGAAGWNSTTARIENIRTGFGAIARLDNGTDLAVAHATGLTPNQTRFSRRAPGATAWTQTNLANPRNVNMLWPNIEASGNYVHVLAISEPAVDVEGVMGQLFYYRSSDGGMTWDIQQAKLPGIDGTKIKALSANQYSIQARGNTVVVAVMPNWGDLIILKSTDNGTTWLPPYTVIDFPDAVENYAANAGDAYTLDDIGGAPDPDRPNENDSLAVFTSDGFGALLIDHNDQVHFWYGRMYVIDNDPAEGSFYYPGVFGINYWREDFGPDSAQYVAGPLDYDGDGFLTITGDDIAPYYNSLSSFPSAGEDADGNIYLAYAALHESYRSGESAEVDKFYRHVYISKSLDGGNSWGPPLDINTVPYLEEGIDVVTEAVWPALPHKIGDEVWVTYQSDYLPGCQIWGDNHSNTANTLAFLAVGKDEIPVGTNDAPAFDPSMAIQVTPNPVTDIAQVSFNLVNKGEVSIQVYNLLGNLLYTNRLSNSASGLQTINMPTAQLSAGVYIVRVNQGGSFGTTRIVK